MAAISLNVDEFDDILPLTGCKDCLSVHCRAFLLAPDEEGDKKIFSQDTLYLHGKPEVLRALASALLKATETTEKS